MKMWSALYSMIAVMLLLLFSFAFFNTTKVLERDFDQARLNHAVEYSTKAMFEKTLEIEDLNMDYDDLGNIQLNSSDALDIFTNLMCINYDMSTSKENKMHIQNSIASTVLAGNDGYYITQLVPEYTLNTDKSLTAGETVELTEEKTLKWSPKVPYYVHKNSKKYAINFVDKTYVAIDNYTNNAHMSNGSIEVSNSKGYPINVTAKGVLQSVNNQITDSIIREIQVANDNKEEKDYKFYLPIETTAKGVNPIDGPSILMLVQGVDYASTQKLNAMSVTGYKVVNKVNVMGLIEKNTGRKFYCYETQIPADRMTEYEIVDFFGNIVEAAQSGYSPHYEFMVRKITK